MKSKWVAMTPERLLCDATGKADFSDVKLDDVVRLIEGTGSWRDNAKVAASLMIAERLTERAHMTGGVERITKEKPVLTGFLRQFAFRLADISAAIEKQIRATCSDVARTKKQ